MDIQNKIIVVTGAASGIGRALAHRFTQDGARRVVIADVDGAGLAQVAAETGAEAIRTDVSQEAQIQNLISRTEVQIGPIDLFCSNAGIGLDGGPEVPDSGWQRIWNINVMAHIWASRALIPLMLARKSGYFLQTVSAAGLLTQIGSAPYAVTKHAALAYAEWLSVTYGDQGLKVSALCPQGVRTAMLLTPEPHSGTFLLEGAIEPEAVAEAVVRGLETEQFLILPHPDVAEYVKRKAADPDRWLRGMRRLQAKLKEAKLRA
jgi:NAD(P)-dependent dehydrogenase (short-subunit alcohol dehydrogenase family)